MFELATIEKTNDNLGKVNVNKRAFKKSLKTESRTKFTKEQLQKSLPNPEEVVFIKTNGLSDVSSILKAISDSFEELNIATWIINKDNIDYLCKLNCPEINIVISNRLKQLKKSDYNYMLENFNANNINFKICNSHAKIFSAKVENNHYTCIGSGNWTTNPRIEVYLIHNDMFIYNENKKWIKELVK